jgi:glycosyltransferase involved in cell wall biosynthesis
MLVAERVSDDREVTGPRSVLDRLATRAAARWDRSLVRRYRFASGALFSPAAGRSPNGSRVATIARDVTHAHWTLNGLLRPEDIARLAGPLVWTLHDMWAFTGGCHYSAGCERFNEACGRCPTLGSDDQRDLSHRVFERKLRAWRRLEVTIVTPSRWLAGLAGASRLLRDKRIEVIPNCIDTDVFRPLNRDTARAAAGLPRDRTIILFAGLTSVRDSRKGFHLLAPALELVARQVPGAAPCLAVLGASRPERPDALGVEVIYLGVVADERVTARLMAAADLFVAPSLEDNLPNTVMEAMSCGTPCVAFHVGGMADLIDHGENGYLARPFEVEDLARGIRFVLEDPSRRDRLGMQARQKTLASYAPSLVANRHATLYADLVRVAST